MSALHFIILLTITLITWIVSMAAGMAMEDKNPHHGSIVLFSLLLQIFVLFVAYSTGKLA